MTDEKVTDTTTAGLLEDAGVTKTYSTGDVAQFFGKTDQWVYWVLREGVLDREDNRLEAKRVGKSKRRRFTLDLIRKMAVSLYDRGTLPEDGLREVLLKLAKAEQS